MELMQASRQWASRPDDQRFLTLEDLKNSVSQRKSESWTATPNVRDLRVIAQDNDDLGVQLFDPTIGQQRVVSPTNWGFNQLAQYAKAPATYLRSLPAELAAINMQWGLEHNSMRDDALVLAQSNGSNSLRAMTSTSYGRIWDIQVVNAVERVNGDGRWQIPAASYATQNPKRATTLYASDRDVFIFLVDPNNPVTIDGEESPLFRGFYIWNSEVGSATFGLTTFLYRAICDNRIIWGATHVKELRMRHTGGAPDRFAYEGQKYLLQYSNEATAEIVQTVQNAKTKEISADKDDPKNTISNWLKDRGFAASIAKGSQEQVVADGGGRSIWDIVNGVTAYARTIPHTDARIDVESKAGKLMNLAA